MRLFLLASVLLAATAAHPDAKGTPAPMRALGAKLLAPEALYSRKALRRARLLIEIRMLELRDERLDCIREAVLARLPSDLRPQLPAKPALSSYGATVFGNPFHPRRS